MADYKRIDDFFSENYKRADLGGWIPIPAEEVDRVCRKLNLRPRPEQKALDFSCGEGRNTRYLYDIGYDVSATDMIDSAIEVARKRLGGRKVRIEKIEIGKPLPFPDREFSLVLAFHTLQWLGSKERFMFTLRDLIRVVADDGHLVFTMPTKRNFHNATGRKIGEDSYEVTTEQRAGCIQYSSNLSTLKDLIVDLGFGTELFGYHEFGYDGAESTVEHPLSMYVFCVGKRR